MCGRFTKYASSAERAAMRAQDWRSIREEWRPKPGRERADADGRLSRDRFNIGPAQLVETIRHNPETDELLVDPLQWGLVPRWTKDLKQARKPINARSETVRTSGMFKDCFARRRCLVPMDAYYEWSGEKAPKQPWAIGRRDGHEFLVGAIWDGWKTPDGAILRTVALITTEPNESLAMIHDRMPVIVQHDDVETWIGGDADAAAGLMLPAPESYLRAWAVGRAVGDVRNDGPELLAPINGSGAQHE